MRTETKLKVAKRKHTVDLLRWLYTRRDPTLCGSKLSLEHRRAQEQDTRVLTYGEVDVPDFLCILDIVKPSDGEVFVDLGSGVGKAVLAAACGFSEFSECRGVEIVKGLSDAATYHLGTLSALLARPSNCGEDVVEPGGTASGTTHAFEADWRCTQGAKQEKLRARGSATTRPSGSKTKKLFDRGLGATDLEELIADFLAKKTSQDRTKIERGNTPSQAFSIESIAAELVKTLGHRRYRASLRGYGGLQKFLARGDGQTSRRISIDQDSGKVALKFTEDLSGTRDMGASGVRKDRRCEFSFGVLPNVCEAACVEDSTESKNLSPCHRQRQEDEGDTSNAADRQAKGCHLREEPSQSPRHDRRHSGQQVEIHWETIRGRDETHCVTRGKCSHPDPSEAGCLDHGALELLSASNSDPRTSDVAVSITPEARPPSPLDRSPRLMDDATALGRNEGLEKPEAENMFAGRPPPATGPVTSESLRRVKFVCGDFFEQRWDDADVVYIASLLFSDGMMTRLRREISKLRKGARIISLKPIPLWDEFQTSGLVMVNDQQGCGFPSPASSLSSLRLVYEGVFKMNWQMARVYIYLVQTG